MMQLFEKYKSLLKDDEGLRAIEVEMTRQKSDIYDTYNTQKTMIYEMAAAIQKSRNVLLLGMGASHFVNQIFAFQIRKMGIEASAIPASEFLYDPIPVNNKIVILTSQSGESIETVKCLPALSNIDVYSVTLTADSTIAKQTKSVICSGGGEKAYAGTRSVTLTLAAFAFVAERLGQIHFDQIRQAIEFEQADMVAMEKAIWTLFSKNSIIATGRSLFAPLAQLFALGCEELGTKPVLCNETGMFRHGPMEILDSDTVLVVFRQEGELGELCTSFEAAQKLSGCSLIVLDSSGLAPLTDAITISCPIGSDITAVLGMMTTFQTLMVAYACGKNPRTGLPRYGSKVTVKE